METPQSGQPITLGSGNQLEAIAKLLPTLFGSKETVSTNPGDTTALQQLITQLQGTDYNKTLQTIFQQAGGQIPGLQAAFSNAVGARSGNNSAVSAALQKLMMETTLAGQKQIADQQLQNQQIQANAGGSIATATKGTQRTDKTQGVGGQLAGLIGLIQAAKMATGSKDLDELGRKFGLGGSRSAGGDVVPVSGPTGGVPMGGAAPVTGAAAPMLSTGPGGFDLNSVLGTAEPVQGSNPVYDFSYDPYTELGGQSMAPSFNFNEVLGGGGMSTPGIPPGGGFNMDWFNEPDFGGGGFDAGYIDPMSWY